MRFNLANDVSVQTPVQTPTMVAYLDWVNAWCSQRTELPTKESEQIVLEDIAKAVTRGTLGRLPHDLLVNVVHKLRSDAQNGKLVIANGNPASCDETNLLSEAYDPRVDCSCDGIGPTSNTYPLDSARALCEKSNCLAVKKVWKQMDTLLDKSEEWNGHGMFTKKGLEMATAEITLMNTGFQPASRSCRGDIIEDIRAPDRRRNDQIDTPMSTFNQAYPTFEELKLCADAKHFFAIACGASLCDDGLARAVADSANDILIGDYCEAADSDTLALLQQTGAAAVAFIQLCRIAGDVSDWQIESLFASILQFRVLGYHRDHARPKLPKTFHGSHMTGITVHRHIDVALMPGLVISSLGTGLQLDAELYQPLAESIILLNDLIDFRSDAMRVQRENPILRGVSHGICDYLNKRIIEVIVKATAMVKTGKLTALVILGFCNWLLMASHHKVYELVTGTEEDTAFKCEYGGWDEYSELLGALEPYGRSKAFTPDVRVKRKDMDMHYSSARFSSETHTSWLADAARTLLKPDNLRRVIDVAHYKWRGNTGDLEYCP